jgi:hypothetical protein
VPTEEDWELQVVKVGAVERDDSGKLLAYILFKNGKQINVSMDKVYRHCLRPMLRFYEEHLNNSVRIIHLSTLIYARDRALNIFIL